MTRFLISITSLEEALAALEYGADIIDLKDPAHGALGALSLETVTEIVNFFDVKAKSERKVISATVGDLPMVPQLLLEKVLALSKTKVDIIKIGFFKDAETGFTDYELCLDALKDVAESGVMLIAVLFAEYEYPPALISAIKNAGFYGMMYDTAHKNGTTFLDYFSTDEIRKIAQNVQARNLLFGLAGSLSLEHVGIVNDIAPDFAGFRGGVCVANQRRSKLDPEKIQAIRKVI